MFTENANFLPSCGGLQVISLYEENSKIHRLSFYTICFDDQVDKVKKI